MEKTNPFNRLEKNIAEDKEFVAVTSGDGKVHLTPYLTLIVAILYMMAADGEISEHECDHLLSVVGADNQVLQRALRYIELNTVDEFFAEAPDAAVEENRICILLNVCDSSMSDGDFDKSEMILFSRMLAIFGQNKQTFKPYFETISIKNKHSVLEVYDKSADNTLTPPLALAATMLYMMSVDGDIAQEEIAQLNISIRKFKDILPDALKYVKKVKFHEFIKLAHPLLTHQQKLCILVNVCDCMLADGHIDRLEQDLFKRMLAGFEITAQNFNKHFQNLSFKNEKPVDIRNKVKSEAEQREIIINTINTEESKLYADTTNEYSKDNVKAPLSDELKNKFGSQISKRMEANSERSDLQHQLEDEVDIISMNAKDVQDGEGQNEKEEEGEADSNSIDLPEKQVVEKKNAPAKKKAIKTSGTKQKLNSDTSADEDKRRKSGDNESNAVIIKKDNWKNSDAEGITELRQLRDAEGDSDLRQYKSAKGPSYQRNMRDADGLDSNENEGDIALDDMQSDRVKNEEGPVHARMDYLKIWTDKLKNNLDKFETINIHHSINRSTGLHLIALKPDYTPALTLAIANQENESKNNALEQKISQHHNPDNIYMNENNLAYANDSAHEAIQSRSRLKLAAITIGLIITQGFTNYGLNDAQSTLLINQSLTSNTHISVQSATIQQTALNLTADLMDKTLATNGEVIDDPADKTKNSSETYRNEAQKMESAPQTKDGKKELKEKINALENSDTTQLTKLKWFGLANSALMMGFFMSFFGLLFRSKISVAGSTSMLTIATLLTLNGFYLVI